MKHTVFDGADQQAIDAIPEKCGAVTVGCADVAGIVQAVIESSANLRAERNALQATVAELEADQIKVSEASDEARLLSERAIERLGQGTSLIQSSLGQISGLLELVETLTTHVTSFAAAMEQVRRCSQDIDQIAETTNILALNATIEAMRAGDAGRTFAVVANEVKSLAGDTRRATEEISRTIDTLGSEAESVIKQIETGAEASKNAKASVARIEDTIGGVADLVEEVDRQNDQIARSTSTISGHVSRVHEMMENLDHAALSSEAELGRARSQMIDLELTACDMFDRIVHANLSPEDRELATICQNWAQQAVDIAEAEIRQGTLSSNQLFDGNHRLIEGSNPPRYLTNLNDWADRHWRPLLDGAVAADPRISAAVCLDQNCYLPTHLSARSKPATGNVETDTQFSRNGRIFDIPINRRAINSNAPFMMSVYRYEGDGTGYWVVRSVFVPMIIAGRRWGNFQISYRSDTDGAIGQ